MAYDVIHTIESPPWPYPLSVGLRKKSYIVRWIEKWLNIKIWTDYEYVYPKPPESAADKPLSANYFVVTGKKEEIQYPSKYTSQNQKDNCMYIR